MSKDAPTSDGLLSTIKCIARGEPGIAPRVFLSVIVTCILVAVACVGSWIFAHLTPRYDARYSNYYIRVSDGNLAASFSVCGLVWTALLLRIWRGNFSRVWVVRPLVSTVFISIAVVLSCVALDEFVGGEEEYLMSATCFGGSAIVLLIWMHDVDMWLKGRAIVNNENQINVSCPQCGYSLIGLRDLRCPECGESYTIDGLIRAQGYGKADLISAIDTSRLPGNRADHNTGSEIASVAVDGESSAPSTASTSDRNARIT